MDCQITAAKVIHFVQPLLLATKCTAADKRSTIWELLKLVFDANDKTLIAQFERHPSLHYLRVAVTDLLTLHLKQDQDLQLQLVHFLNTYYDLELVEQQPDYQSDASQRTRLSGLSRVVEPLRRVRHFLTI